MVEPHHDHSYKDLFSHREMIRDLLLGFVHEEWLAQTDLDSLETVKGSFITDDLREREDDRKRPGIQLPTIDDYEEVHAVLEERVEQWNRELIEKGRQEGRLEGRLEGETRLLLRMLVGRFGPLPDWVEPRLAQASETELEALADRVLDAESLDALFADSAKGH